MHSDPGLVERLFSILPETLEPKIMFGGQCWMLGGHMCLGVYKQDLIVRVGIEQAGTLLNEPHIRPMDITGKVMKGWAMIEPEAIETDDNLRLYSTIAIEFVLSLPPK